MGYRESPIGEGETINQDCVGVKKCKLCNERIYYIEDKYCYYHKKVKGGLTEPDEFTRIDYWGGA